MHRTKIFPALFSAFFAIAVVAMTSLVMTSLGMSAPAMTALLGAQPGPHGSVVAPETSNEQSKTSLQAFDQAKISLKTQSPQSRARWAVSSSTPNFKSAMGILSTS